MKGFKRCNLSVNSMVVVTGHRMILDSNLNEFIKYAHFTMQKFGHMVTKRLLYGFNRPPRCLYWVFTALELMEYLKFWKGNMYGNLKE